MKFAQPLIQFQPSPVLRIVVSLALVLALVGSSFASISPCCCSRMGEQCQAERATAPKCPKCAAAASEKISISARCNCKSQPVAEIQATIDVSSIVKQQCQNLRMNVAEMIATLAGSHLVQSQRSHCSVFSRAILCCWRN